MRRFVDAFSIRFPQAVSEDGSLWVRFGVPYQPAWVFVNDDGTAHVVHGLVSEPDLEMTLDQLIAS